MLISSTYKLVISISTLHRNTSDILFMCIRVVILILTFVSHFVLQGAQINEAACDLAREVANEGDALVAGGVCQTPSYLSCKSETEVKGILKKQLDVFIKKNVDFLIAEVEIHLIFLTT